MRNVPDDWDCYWSRCAICGSRYHASDGGCDCTDDLDSCSCGANEWTVDDETIICAVCDTEPGSPPLPPEEQNEQDE